MPSAFGARELFRDRETGELEGVRGSYVQHGRAYFEDDRSGLRYRITDPVTAFADGVDGWALIAARRCASIRKANAKVVAPATSHI